MAKYNYEFKMKVVQAYLFGEGGFSSYPKNMAFLLQVVYENGSLHITGMECLN